MSGARTSPLLAPVSADSKPGGGLQGVYLATCGPCYAALDADPLDAARIAHSIEVEREFAALVLRESEVLGATGRVGPPVLSVLVSSCEAEAFMAECLEDLFAQENAPETEVIVVDAASPEDERSVVERFRRQHGNIVYVRTPERIGIYPAWNVALHLAAGRYVVPMSTNDRLGPAAHAQLAALLVERHDVALVYGDSYVTKVAHERFADHARRTGDLPSFSWPDYDFVDLLFNCRVGPHPMWRRSVHRSVGYFDGRYAAIGDQDFWLRLGRNHRLWHLVMPTGLAWISENSLSARGESMLEVSSIQHKHQEAYRKYGARLGSFPGQRAQPSVRQNADELFRRAQTSLRMNRPQELSVQLAEILRIDPGHAGAWGVVHAFRQAQEQALQVRLRDPVATGTSQSPIATQAAPSSAQTRLR